MGFIAKETDLVRSCLDWLALHRIMAWRSNNTGIFDPAKKIFRTFHGRKGVADVLGVFPQTVELKDGRKEVFGNALAIECKRPGEDLRPDQAEFLQEIQRNGGIGICVHSLDELEAQLRPFMD